MPHQHANGWQVGMEVVVVLHGNRRDPNVSVEKITAIGRRWISLPHRYRFDADTMFLDGGGYSSPGRVWPSMREYQDSLEVNKLWSELRGMITYTPPEHVTIEDVKRLIAGVRSDAVDAPTADQMGG